MDERLLKAENIVFDVGNVLLSFQGEKVGRLLKKEIRDKLVPVMFGERHLWGEFDKGRESNEDIARRIAREGGEPGAVEDVLHTLYHFPEIMTPLPLYHMLDELRGLGKRLYALTNYPEPSFTFTCERFPSLVDKMDGAVVSAREKVVKPDPAIFRLLMERYRLIPERSLFIDDTPANVEAAAQLGFQTWLYAEEDRIV